MSIQVALLVGTSAVSRSSGDKLRSAIERKLTDEGIVEIDFSEVRYFASPFFNTAIAPLLEKNSIQQLQKKLVFSNLSQVGKSLLNQVIDNAVRFYSKDLGKIEDHNNTIHNAASDDEK